MFDHVTHSFRGGGTSLRGGSPGGAYPPVSGCCELTGLASGASSTAMPPSGSESLTDLRRWPQLRIMALMRSSPKLLARLVLVVACVLVSGSVSSCTATGSPERSAAEADAQLDEANVIADEAVADAAIQDLYSEGQSDGETAGEEAGRTAGHESGYGDAESGDDRGTSEDTTPDSSAAEYSPESDEDVYLEGYDEGYNAAYVPSYEAAYQEGYDEALDYYGDPQVENPNDLDCSDFGGPVVVGPDDPNHLDADGDGLGCDGE